MWAKLRRRNQPNESKQQPDQDEPKKKNVKPPKAAEHHYFKGHECSIPLHKQTKYEIEDNRKGLQNTLLYFTSVRSGDIRARYMYRSYAELSAEIHRHYKSFPFAIHPYSRLRLIVEAISLVILQICLMILNLYFVWDNTLSIPGYLINVCECLYCVTIIVNFFTGYEKGLSSKYIVLDSKRIACYYLRTWCIPDLAFVAGLAKLFVKYDITVDTLISSLKILIIPAIFRYTQTVLQVFGASETAKNLINIAQIVGNYILWNMIFQFSLEYLVENTRQPTNPRNCSWLTITNMWNASYVEREINAFNRAEDYDKISNAVLNAPFSSMFDYTIKEVALSVGMLQQNSNLNLLEQEGCFEVFFVMAWRVGKLVEIHCALKCMLMLFGLESAQARYFMITQQVQTFLDQRRFPARLKKKILKFYSVRYQANFFVEHRMMECVSGRLREDIIMHSSRQLVGEVEFLKHLPRSLLLQISVKLKVVVFLAGDIIFKINTVGDCLYFIDKGTVAIYSESGQEICHLQDGDFFGEIALVLQPLFRTASAVAVTNCELFRLDKKDFESTIAIFPTVYEDIKKVAFERLERTTVMDEHHKAELKIDQNAEDQIM